MFWVLPKKPSQKMESRFRSGKRRGMKGPLNDLQGSGKRNFAIKKGIQKDTEAPDLGRLGVVSLPF
jgi:hypothetical protein